MEWDESRVYTALNADKLEIGSTVVVADTLKALKYKVEKDITWRLVGILDETLSNRFQVADGADESDGASTWNLAYLVEEKKLKWTDLKIGDIIKHDNFTNMVTSIDSNINNNDMHILAGDLWLTDRDLKDWEKVEND